MDRVNGWQFTIISILPAWKLFSPSNVIADDVFRYRFLFVNTNFRYINHIAPFVVLLNVFYEPFPYTYEKNVNMDL